MRRIVFALAVVCCAVLLMAVECVPGLFVYLVTYDGNGSTGGAVPTDAMEYRKGDIVTVLNAGTLERTGYAFDGWNTTADGTGTDRAVGATFEMAREDVTLYAQWREQTAFELLVGTWAHDWDDYYHELVFGSDYTFASLVYDAEGGTLLGDMTTRGTFTLEGDIYQGTMTEMYYDGAWHAMDPPMVPPPWTLDTDDMRDGVWTMEVDLNGDEVIDDTWTLVKQ